MTISRSFTLGPSTCSFFPALTILATKFRTDTFSTYTVLTDVDTDPLEAHPTHLRRSFFLFSK